MTPAKMRMDESDESSGNPPIRVSEEAGCELEIVNRQKIFRILGNESKSQGGESSWERLT